MVTGGYGISNVLSSAELFDPITETWTEASDSGQPRAEHTASLLPNGDVLVAGGSSDIGSLNTAEIYQPSAGTWTDTGAMNTGRYAHTATLLPNGRVVVAGGVSNEEYTDSTELYDPASGTWSTSATLAAPRANHTATLLETGTVLIAGGLNGNVVLTGAELYDVGLGFLRPDYQPHVTTATNPLMLGQSLVVSGSRFKGISEASGSNGASSSPTNYPVVQIRSIDNADEVFLPVDPLSGFTDLVFTSTALLGFTPGPALVTVFTNGIPSDSYYIVVALADPTVTLHVPATASIGVPLTASVTISGGANPRGTIIFQLFGHDAPNCDSEPVAFLPVSIDGNGTYTSGSYTPLVAGTYH